MRIPNPLAGILLAMLPAVVAAQAYPSRPIRIIVPYTAGGSSDFYRPDGAQKLAAALDVQVVVNNRPGGNTLIGAELMVKSPPDGYTLLVAGLSTFAAQPYLYRKLPYDPAKDFALVNNIVNSSLVLAVTPSFPPRSVQELIAYAKANPGKVNFGSAGVGNTLHLAAELFKARTGTDMTHIPYKGASQALGDLVSGRVQIMFDVIQTQLQQIAAGKVRALATTGARRAAALKDVPTVIEAGVPGYTFSANIGLFGPAGMPKAVVDRLHAELAKILLLPEVREAFAQQAMEAEGFPSPEAYAAWYQNEIRRMGEITRAAAIQPE